MDCTEFDSLYEMLLYYIADDLDTPEKNSFELDDGTRRTAFDLRIYSTDKEKENQYEAVLDIYHDDEGQHFVAVSVSECCKYDEGGESNASVSCYYLIDEEQRCNLVAARIQRNHVSEELSFDDENQTKCAFTAKALFGLFSMIRMVNLRGLEKTLTSIDIQGQGFLWPNTLTEMPNPVAVSVVEQAIAQEVLNLRSEL